MSSNDQFKERVRQANDIIEIISEYVDLKKSGKEYVGLCPFHEDKTPSFNVNPDKHLFHCKGCGIGGDVFQFIMKLKGLTFPEALKFLADKVGLEIPEPKHLTKKERELKKGMTYSVIQSELENKDTEIRIKAKEKKLDKFLIQKLRTDALMDSISEIKELNLAYQRLIKDWIKEKWDIGPNIVDSEIRQKRLETSALFQSRKIIQFENSYIKPGKGAITNFTIEPLERIQVERGEFLKANIQTHKKLYAGVIFNPDSWISKAKFKGALKGYLDTEYKGTDDDIQDIKGILVSKEPPIKQGVKKTGLHRIDKEWIYVEEKDARDKTGERKDIVYLSENPYEVELLKEPVLTHLQLNSIIANIADFNAPDVVYPLLGFCFSCFVKKRIENITRQNPLLVCWGEKGSGKTQTLERIIKPLFGIKTSAEDISLPTKFSFARVISSSNLAPILFDEHKLGKIDKFQRNRISEMFTATFNQHRLTRGQPNLEIVEFVYTAPVVVAGETGTTEVSLNDRIIEIYFSKKKIEDKKQIFELLTRSILGSLGKDFLLWTLRLEDQIITDTYLMQLENVDSQLRDRLRTNTARARLGLALFLKYLIDQGKETRKFEEGFDIIDEAQIKNILEESNKTIVDNTLEAFSVMIDKGIIKQGKDFKIDLNGNLNLYIPGIYPEFKKWARDYQYDGEVIDKNSFLRQVKEAKYFIKEGSVRFDKSKWTLILDISQMDHLDISNFKD